MTKDEFRARVSELVEEYIREAGEHEDCVFEECPNRIADFAIYVHESQRGN